MLLKLKRTAIFACQAVICVGALAVTRELPDPGALKTPLMLLGITGLLPLLAFRMRMGTHLLPGLLLFAYLYILRLTPSPNHHATALALLSGAAAFLLGISRVPLASVKLLLPFILLCIGRGLMDLITLNHLGGNAPPGHSVTSFFLDKHAAGGVLILAAFLHFHLMEKGGPQKPVQVLLYTSSLVVMLAIVLSDSRIVQGAFLACFMPLLFLTIRLDGHEPAPERLAWIAGITLCLGLAWINLPELHHRRVAEVFSPSEPGMMNIAWTTALGIVGDAPLAGSGTGGFRYAAVDHMGSWTEPGTGGALPTLTHAHSHFLQVLAEGGAIACALEAFLLFIALLGTALMYFREWKLQAKYAFFSLAALSLIGLFTSALDTAPLSIAYWALVGYGWSFAAEAIPRWLLPYRDRLANPRRRDRMVGAITAIALTLLIGWHLAQRLKEIHATRIYMEAQAMSQANPRKSTDMLAKALAWDPRNEEANYSYARVLAFFNRGSDALKRVAYVQATAPDWRREAEVLAEIYITMGRHVEGAHQMTLILDVYPHYLAGLEMKAEALKQAGRCETLDSFRLSAVRLGAVYPMPNSRDYTIQSLDSLFTANRDINFLQRWFGGPGLRQNFVERKMIAYNRGFQYHSRSQFLKEARCPVPEDGPPDSGYHEGWPLQAPAGITPEGEPEPTRWEIPKPKTTPKRRRKRRKPKQRYLAGMESPAPIVSADSPWWSATRWPATPELRPAGSGPADGG